MGTTNGEPYRDWTPEEKAAIYAEMKKKFTADDLYGYVEDTEERFPMEQVMAEAEALLEKLRAEKREARG